MAATVKFKRPPKRRTISQAAADRKVAPKAGPAKPTELPKLPRMRARPKKARPQRPTERMAKEKDTTEKDLRGEALSLVAQAALAMPGKSRAGKVIKGALTGAAIGGQLGLAVEKWRGSRKSKKGGGRAKLSQEAVSKPHAKPKKTKKEETV